MNDDLFSYADSVGSEMNLPETRKPSTELVVKEHGSAMSLSEFAGWIENNIGTSISDALEQAAFLLCCDVIAQDISKSTLRLRERLANGTSRAVLPTEHPIAGMLALEPNERHTWVEYVEMVTYWECFTSNSFAVVKRTAVGDPLALIPVQTGRVLELVNPDGSLIYRVTASTLQERALLGASVLIVPERDMIHVRGRMLDGLDGYSTLTAGKKTLDAGKALEDLRESIFSQDGQQRGVFTRDGAVDANDVMDDKAFQRLRQQLRELMNRYRRTAEPIVLEGGLKFESISSNPKDIELAAQFTQQINATCRLLRVPPHKVFNLDNTKYDNMETMEKDYVSSTLVPICTRFEQRYGKLLLSGKDRLRYVFEHDRDMMMLRDTAKETERAVKSLGSGAIDFDEFRAVIGKNPLPNGVGKHRMIPTNMTIIDENENVIIGGSSTPSADANSSDTPPADGSADQPADPAKKAALRLVQ